MKPMVSTRRVFAALFLASVPIWVRGDTVTLPVAASVQGLAPFFSDVRVFNTSYVESVTVTAVYRAGSQPARTFTLGPREAKSFDDICVSLFGTPNSLGAVEFTSTASAGTVVVTSRLYSPFPLPTGGAVGMFIPGLPSTSAKAVTVLAGLMNGVSRTNVGVYNPSDVSVSVAVRLFDGPVLLGTVPLTLGPRTGTQISNIYKSLGFETLVRTDGYCTVESSSSAAPLFSYAAMADNATQDTILVVGAPDVAAPAGFNPPTPTVVTPSTEPTLTPTAPGLTPTPTPTPTASSAIVVNLMATQFKWSFNGGGSSFTMRVGQTYELRISDADPPGNDGHGFSGIPALAISKQSPLSPGEPPIVVLVTPGRTGSFGFSCDQSGCGIGHDDMLGVLTVTN